MKDVLTAQSNLFLSSVPLSLSPTLVPDPAPADAYVRHDGREREREKADRREKKSNSSFFPNGTRRAIDVC